MRRDDLLGASTVCDVFEFDIDAGPKAKEKPLDGAVSNVYWSAVGRKTPVDLQIHRLTAWHYPLL